MAKETVYHLDECVDCVHRNVCKFVDKIDKLISKGDLPLDLRGASCVEYEPDDSLEAQWEGYMTTPHDSVSSLLFTDAGEEDPTESMTDDEYMEHLILSLQEQDIEPVEKGTLTKEEVMERLKYVAETMLDGYTMTHLISHPNTIEDANLPVSKGTIILCGLSVKVVVDDRVPYGAFAFMSESL